MNPPQRISYQDFPFLNRPISVAIIDDHPVATDGLRSQLEAYSDIQVVAICHKGDEALEVISRTNPDLVIIDMELRGSRLNGIQVARQLRQQFGPSPKMLVLSAYDDLQKVLGAVSAGVDGYLLKTSSAVEITHAIYTVMSGATIWDPSAKRIIELFIGNNMDALNNLNALAEEGSGESLTEREWEVLELIAQGNSNSEIANTLVISPGTVKVHIQNIFAKINVTSREQARVWYYVYRNEHNR